MIALMETMKIYLRSQIELASKENNEGLYRAQGKFIEAGVVERGWFKLKITEEALQKAFESVTKQGKAHAKYMMHQEDEIIGHAANFVLEDGFIKGDYFINPKVQRGAETIALIEGKTLDAFSIGFSITNYDTKASAPADKGEETLVVNDFKINEISVVDIPAVESARIEEELKMAFKQFNEKEGGKLEKKEEVSLKKEDIFKQIEAFQALAKTFDVGVEVALNAVEIAKLRGKGIYIKGGN